MKNFNSFFNQLTAMLKRLAMVLTVLFTLGVGSMLGQEVLFHETFGNNSNSARNWSDSYSVKSGVSEVYTSVTYTMSNLKQSKNTVGCTQSGLLQTTAGTDASIIIGPLNVSNYEDLKLSFMYKAGSVKNTYKRSAQYKTTSNGTWKDLFVSGTQNASTCYEQEATLPVAAEGIETLYIKIIFNTSNTQATIDEVEITGTKKASCTEPTVAWTTEPANGVVGGTMKASATTNYPAGLTYTSSDIDVAYVDNSGNITYKAAGNTTITATVTGDGNTYCDKTVTVSKQISVTCGNNVKISKGTETNGTFSISKTGTYETCDGALVITLSNITPSTGYQFGEITQSGINTGVTIDQENKKVTYEQNTSGTSTINVTFNALPTHTVTWIVNGKEYTEGTPTDEVYEGAKWSSLTLPTAPNPKDYCGQVFAGWTTTNIGSTGLDKDNDAAAIQKLNLMTSENKSSKTNTITEPTTFYAVFADYAD